MEPQTLVNADYLDIIFDKRNKMYGGYELRRNYNRRVRKAAGIVILSACVVLSFSFVKSGRRDIVAVPNVIPTVVTNVTTTPRPMVPPKVIHPARQRLNTRTLTPPRIVTDTQVPEDKKMTDVKDMHNAQPGPADNTGDSLDIRPVSSGPGKEGGVVVAKSSMSMPVTWVEQMPQFPGDMNAYLATHLHYPAMASDNGITGKVLLAFVVNEDGSVTDVTVLHGIGGGCDEEAVRVVKSSPVWKPGKHNGIPVKVLFRLPIVFELK